MIFIFKSKKMHSFLSCVIYMFQVSSATIVSGLFLQQFAPVLWDCHLMWGCRIYLSDECGNVLVSVNVLIQLSRNVWKLQWFQLISSHIVYFCVIILHLYLIQTCGSAPLASSAGSICPQGFRPITQYPLQMVGRQWWSVIACQWLVSSSSHHV